MANLNAYYGLPRIRCTGGQSGFFIQSNGDASRCASFYYDRFEIIGNVCDENFRKRIVEGADKSFQCPKGTCIAECDGHHNSQTIVTKEGMIRHVAERAEAKDLVGKRHGILQISITSTCNYKCSYCCADVSMKAYAGKDLSAEAWKDVATFFTGVFPAGNVSMLGGEPTVHPGLTGCVKAFMDGGWHVDLFTNLSLPKKVFELVDGVSELPRLFVIVSIHPTQKQFSLDKIVDAVCTLGGLGVQYGYSFVATPENVQLDKEHGIFERLGRETKPRWASSIRDVHSKI